MSSFVGEWNCLLLCMYVCSVLIECSGLSCVVIMMCCLMWMNSVVIFDGVSLRLNIMLLMIVCNVLFFCLMCVECEFLCRNLKKLLGNLRCVCI